MSYVIVTRNVTKVIISLDCGHAITWTPEVVGLLDSPPAALQIVKSSVPCDQCASVAKAALGLT